MDIRIKNFGKISEADIKLSGLTLIAGPNDSGKSTVGKCLFSIVKSVINYPEYYNSIITEQLYKEYLNPIKIDFNRYLRRKPMFSGLFDSKNIDEDIVHSYEHLFSKELKISSIDEKITFLKTFSACMKKEENFKNINKIIQDALKFLDSKNNDNEKIKFICDRVFSDVFSNNLTNSLHQTDTSQVEYYNEKENILSLKIKSNAITNIIDFAPSIPSFTDATFIDNPLLLEREKNNNRAVWKYFEYEDSIANNIDITNDIIDKKERAIRLVNKENYYADLFSEFKSIFNKATFAYSNKDDKLKYKVDEKASELEISNIASGSKAFGLLYVLLKSGTLTKDGLLILDEPENHLHPEWQLKYAQIICKMVKNGFHVLMTSHSPYMIQAIETYSKQEKIFNDKVNFYYTDKSNKENYNIIINIRDKYGNFNDDIIFKSLYTPIENLENINSQISEEIRKDFFKE